jgi:hypothetical protein
LIDRSVGFPDVKVNLLARWNSSDLRDYITAQQSAARHPLVAKPFETETAVHHARRFR